MSVAVPRPLNASMNPNIASRPTPGSSSSSSTIRARPPALSGNTGGSHSRKMSIPARPPMDSRTSSASTSTVASTQAAHATASASASGGGNKDTSSSAGKVFAKPSKEWVLPERAKPGRKVSAEEPDNKRQSQNRLSQRAHRARRTDYITTLEDRLRQYEADEIHSNVRLQEVARALKSDNERMKNELMLIRGKMNEVYAEKEGWDSERRNLEDMCASLMSEVERLRSSTTGDGLKLEPSTTTRIVRRVSTSTGVHQYPEASASTSTSRTIDKRVPIACPICPDPDPDCPCQQPVQSPIPAPIAIPHQSACGLCTTPAECLCRVVAENPSPSPKPTPSASASAAGYSFGIEGGKTKCDVCTSLTVCLCEDDTPPLPRASAAVPLSLRSKTRAPNVTGVERPKKTFWKLDNVITKGEAVCSGDPSNCDACRDDTFGKEFCGHLFEPPPTTIPTGSSAQVVQKKPCINCPGNCMSINNLVTPTPNPVDTYTNEGFIVHPPTPSPTPEEQAAETMRCDEAWKKLKAHPNAKFASLALLADVVAGRTKCTGPTIELSPVPAHMPSPLPPRASSIGVGVAHSPVHASHTHTHTAPTPVPASGLGSGVKRRMGVETSAVRDALRILDSTPSRATSELGQVKAEPVDLDEVNERAVKRVRVE